jgi:hypothetical protein
MLRNKWLLQALGVLLVAGLAAGLLASLAPERSGARAGPTTYYIAPAGRDSNAGTAPGAPFASIQRAVDLAQPGDVIELAPGTYMQDVVSRRDGTAAAPITIRGPAGAVVKGGGADRVFEIHHDYLTLEGFTIDGLWGEPSRQQGYREKLLYVVGRQPRDGVTGLKVLGMTFKNGGGECLRLRYFAQHNEVARSSFAGCGVHDFKFSAGKRNGEAIYIGTAPEQRANGENPTADVDQSDENWIHDNIFDTQGNECVDIKEGSSGNVVERNHCTGQQDPNSGGFDARGSGNIFRYNTSYGNVGAGIRLGGDGATDGIDNQVYGNTFYGNGAGGIKLVRGPQKLCGNTVRDNHEGNVVGVGRERADPAAVCAAQAAQGSAPVEPAQAQAPSPTQARPPPSAGAQSYAPALDTYVSSDAPARSYAQADRLKVDATPETWVLLRFELPQGQPVRRALLKLYPQGTARHGGAAHAVAGGWDAGVTWGSRPQPGAQIAELGSVKKGDWVTIDVTAAIQSGVLAVAILPQSEHAASYYASEDGSKYAPRLVVER